jgi:hypothetical protein
MANVTEVEEALKKFEEKAKLAKKLGLPGEAEAYANQVIFHRRYPDPENVALQLEEINLHLVFLTNIIELHQTINDPKNDPAKLYPLVGKETQNLINEFVPTIQKVIAKSCRALEADYMTSRDDRMKTIAYLGTAIQHTTDMVKDKNKDPSEIRRLLHDASQVKQNFVLRAAKRNPEFTAFLGLFSIASGIGLIVGGVAACTLPGGLIVGIPMIAAGVMLAIFGKKMLTAADVQLTRHQHISEGIARRKVRLAEFGDNIKKLATSKQTLNTFEITDTVLTNATLVYQPNPRAYASLAYERPPAVNPAYSASMFTDRQPLIPEEAKQHTRSVPGHKRSRSRG